MLIQLFIAELYIMVTSHKPKGYSSQSLEVKRGIKEGIVLHVKEQDARPFQGDIKIELRKTNFVKRSVSIYFILLFLFLQIFICLSLVLLLGHNNEFSQLYFH